MDKQESPSEAETVILTPSPFKSNIFDGFENYLPSFMFNNMGWPKIPPSFHSLSTLGVSFSDRGEKISPINLPLDNLIDLNTSSKKVQRWLFTPEDDEADIEFTQIMVREAFKIKIFYHIFYFFLGKKYTTTTYPQNSVFTIQLQESFQNPLNSSDCESISGSQFRARHH